MRRETETFRRHSNPHSSNGQPSPFLFPTKGGAVSLLDLVKRAEKLAVDNSPVLLAGIGVAGTITTALFAGRAGFKAAEVLEQDRETLAGEQDMKRVVKLTWTLYIPAIGTGVLTVA